MLQVDQLLQNRYLIIRILGQGGMGAVYEAHDKSLDVACVVKEMLPPDPSQVRNMSIQFQREGKILAGLRHLSLPRVTNYFNESDNYYLVMDLIAGRSLESLIAAAGLPEATVLKYGDQLLDVLEYIHAQGLLHRDIKPANIIIQPDDRAVLVDFGLVKIVTAGPQSTKTLVSALSPQYAPPEQYTGNTDQRSDLYSLAATLYQSLAGHPPSSATDQLSGIKLMPLRQLPHLTTPVSPNTEYVLMKGLTLDRNARYQDAATMRSELAKGSGKVYSAAPAPVNMNAATQVLSPVMTSSTPVHSQRDQGAPTQVLRADFGTGVPVPTPIGSGYGTVRDAGIPVSKPKSKTGLIGAVALVLVLIAGAAVVIALAGKPANPAAVTAPITASPATTASPTTVKPKTTATKAATETTEPSQTPMPSAAVELVKTATLAVSSATVIPAPSVTLVPMPTALPKDTALPAATKGPTAPPAATAAPQSPGMLFPAPVLLEPQTGFSYKFPYIPTLKWSPVPGLGPDDYYLVEISHQQGVDPMYLKDTSTPPHDYILDLPRDPYLWQVTVVRKTANGYVAVSPPSTQWDFRWTRPKKTATPHP